jgi:hypothetical protein
MGLEVETLEGTIAGAAYDEPDRANKSTNNDEPDTIRISKTNDKAKVFSLKYSISRQKRCTQSK